MNVLFKLKNFLNDKNKKSKIMTSFDNTRTQKASAKAENKYKDNALLHSVVNKISESVAKTNFKLYSTKKTERKLVIKHTILSLLKAPNPFMTGYELLFSLSALLTIKGEAFLYVELDQAKKPLYLWLLSNKEILDINANKTTIMLKNNRIEVNSEDLIIFKKTNPLNLYGAGQGIFDSIAQNAQVVDNISNYLQNFFYNNTNGGGILKIDADAEDLEDFRSEFDATTSEAGQFRTYILNTDFEYVKTSVDVGDLGIETLLKVYEDSIRKSFSVPEALIGGDGGSRASSMVAKDTFLRETIIPMLDRIVSTLNIKLVQRYFSTDLTLEHSVVADSDKEQRLKLMQNFPDCFEKNEVRILAGFEPIESFKGEFSTKVENREYDTQKKGDYIDDFANNSRKAEQSIE